LRLYAAEHRNVFHLHEKGKMPISQLDQTNIFAKTLPPSFELYLRFHDMKYPQAGDKNFETLVKETLEEAEKQAAAGHKAANQVVYSNPSVHASNANAAHGMSTPKPAPTYSYCWSHGLVTNPTHTSATCNSKIKPPHHDATATITNYKTKGGKLSVWKKGDKLGP
jgi:hypothetical protein